LTDETKKVDMLSQVDRFLAKVELELNNKTGAINDAAYMPNVKPV